MLDIYVGAYLTDWRYILEKSASDEYIHLHLPKYPLNTTQDLPKRDAQALIPPTHKHGLSCKADSASLNDEVPTPLQRDGSLVLAERDSVPFNG